MDETVSKFIEYLNKSALDISAYSLFKVSTNPNYSDDVLVREYNDTYMRFNTINFLGGESQNELLLDFNNLSSLLIDSPLNTRERAKIIFYCMKKNIKNGILERKIYIYTDEKIEHYNFKFFSKDEARIFLNSNACYALLTADPNALVNISSDNLLIKQEIEDFIEKENCDISSSFKQLITMHKTFESIYFNKKNSITEEEFNELVKALKEADMNEEIINNIIYILKKKVVIPITYKDCSKTNEALSFNDLFDKLNEYFIASKKQVKKVLTFNEQIFCVSLLLRLKFKKSEINEFLRLSNKYNKQNLNIVAYYIYLYPKLSILNNDNIKQKMNDINTCIMQMFISSNTDYEDWKNLLNAELTEIMDLLPQNYDLEMGKAKTL